RRSGSGRPATTWRSRTWSPRCEPGTGSSSSPASPFTWKTTTPARSSSTCWARPAPERTVTMTTPASFETRGTPLRVEDPRLLRGRGRSVDNLAIEGALVARFVRSPHAAARVAGIDVRPALAVPGVVAVFTARDLPGAAQPLPVMIPHPDQPDGRMPGALAAGRVRLAGEAVALVVARDRYAAEDAAERVEVAWEPLPAVSGIAAALEGRVRVHDDLPDNVAGRSRQRAGDPDAAFARARRVLHFDLWIHRGSAQPMETR